MLHGANSSSELLAGMQPMVERMWADGSLPQSILACVSTPTVGGFYIGHWERLVAVEFQQMISRRYDADPARVALMGSSMGGYGALKIAFADPSRWAAVAATAPAVLPADPPPRNTIGVLAQLAAEMGAAGFEANSVLHRLHANASAVRDSGLPIFLRVGDRDLFNMHDGTEQLHRALWDLDIGHDYHLVFGGDHVGPEAPAAQRAALAFVGAALRAQPADPEWGAPWLLWASEGRHGPPPSFDPAGEAAPTAMRVLIGPELADAALRDPTAVRRYGILG